MWMFKKKVKKIDECNTCPLCRRQYTNIKSKWCRLCQSSGNKQIDDFIQKESKYQLKNDIVFELIPYHQFYNIKEIARNNSTKIYSAIWEDGPLFYDYENNELIRKSNRKIILKYSHNLQDLNKFLDEVRKYLS